MNFAIPEIESERLVLRCWREADVEPLLAFYRDPATQEIFGKDVTLDDVWRRVAGLLGHWLLKGYGSWALETKPQGEFAGYAGLWFRRELGEVELGYGLAPAHRGKGLASEAGRRVCRFAYEELRLPSVVSFIAPSNTASIAVAEGLGAASKTEIEFHGKTCRVFRYPNPIH